MHRLLVLLLALAGMLAVVLWLDRSGVRRAAEQETREPRSSLARRDLPSALQTLDVSPNPPDIAGGIQRGRTEFVQRTTELEKVAGGAEPLPHLAPVADPVLTARVSGIVRGPRGGVIAGATIRVSPDSRRPDPSARGSGAASAGDGVFHLRELAPGKIVLVAEHAELASSLPFELELAAGEDLEGVVLRLRAGASILGEVAGADGMPVVGRDVITFGGGEPRGRRTATDPDGRFEFRGLPPGEITLSTLTSDGLELRRDLVLRDGETARVRFSPPEAPLVRLHGVVSAGAGPETDAILTAELDERSFSRSRSTRTDEDGTYELELPGAGQYVLSIESKFSWRTSVDVPDVDDFQFDVSIPVGRISGRVTAQGEPVADVLVETEPERHEGDSHGSARARTDADGRYELVVPPGLHSVKAGGSTATPGDESHAEARVQGLRIAAGAHLSGIDLVLSEAGALEGVVRTEEGAPVSCADLWSFESPRPRWLGRCEGDGRFHLEGLTRGTLLLGASLERSATGRRLSVAIEPGTTQRVELVLAPAVPVHVLARREGALVDCELALVGEDGTAYAMRSERAGEAWFGPLTAGSYLVSARDRTRVERTLEIRGTEERLDVELVLE